MAADLCGVDVEYVEAAETIEKPCKDVILILLILKLVIDAVLLVNRICPFFIIRRLAVDRTAAIGQGRVTLAKLVKRQKYAEAVQRFGVCAESLTEALLDEYDSTEVNELLAISAEVRG